MKAMTSPDTSNREEEMEIKKGMNCWHLSNLDAGSSFLIGSSSKIHAPESWNATAIHAAASPAGQSVRTKAFGANDGQRRMRPNAARSFAE